MSTYPNNFEENERAFAAPQLKEEQDNPANILAMSSYVDQRASIRPYLSLFGLLLIGFSLLSAMTHAKPAAMENLVKKIPYVGATVLKNNHLKDGVLLRSLRTGYQNIHGDREVLVLTGVAFNQNPVVIREVKVTGTVFNLEGKEIEKQTIWIGNTLSPKIIRGMTAEDIPHLQDLETAQEFRAPAGGFDSFYHGILETGQAGQRLQLGSRARRRRSLIGADYHGDSSESFFFGVISTSSAWLTALRNLRMLLPMPSPRSGSRLLNSTRTITSTTSNSPMPNPNIGPPDA